MPRLSRLLYISESRIDWQDLSNAVSQIILVSKQRNVNLALTGTLLFAGKHFVQILEGPSDSIAQMMSSLKADRRHANIAVIIHSRITMRKFSDWRLAYHGPSKFVADQVFKVLSAKTLSEQKRATEWLIKLALEFSKDLAA